MAWETTVTVTNGVGPYAVDTGSQAVGAGLAQVALIQLNGNRGWAVFDIINTGANALTHLQFSRTGVSGGTHTVIPAMSDASLNTSSVDVPSAAPASLSTLAAGATGNLRLGGLRGAMEIGVWAQAATATSLQVKGTVAD